MPDMGSIFQAKTLNLISLFFLKLFVFSNHTATRSLLVVLVLYGLHISSLISRGKLFVQNISIILSFL